MPRSHWLARNCVQAPDIFKNGALNRAAIKGIAKVPLHNSAPFLAALHSAFSGKTLLNKLYSARIFTVTQVRDSGGNEFYFDHNEYMPQAFLKADTAARSIFFNHMKEKSIEVSQSEAEFFTVEVLPMLKKVITGGLYVSEKYKQMNPSIKADLLERSNYESVLFTLKECLKKQNIPPA